MPPNGQRVGRARAIAGLVIGVSTLLLVIANARLIYVATTSEPACVPHARLGEGAATPGHYSAAQSACSPVERGGDLR
jgi:hypothetical protein